MAAEHSRTCRIVKTPEEEFEFFLRFDGDRKGQIIVSVTSKGPADRAGLKDGDRIIEVNGQNVEKVPHTEVAQLIKKSMPDNKVEFQVIDEQNDPNKPQPKTNGDVKSTSQLRPRLCKMKKKRNTFGFNLEAQGSSKPGHFISEVADGGPAMEAGMKKGDRIIEVGGNNVEKLNHAKVVALIKKSGTKVNLLVADDETYKHFLKQKMKIKPKHSYSTSDVVTDNSTSSGSTKVSKSAKKSAPRSTSALRPSNDEKARLVHVVKPADKGYGFFLRVKKDEKGEYIGDVVSGKPGEKCGLMEDDRVIAVNGKGILLKTHEEVVQIIKTNPHHGVFVVMGPKAIENAKNNGISSALSDAKELVLEKPRKAKLSKGSNGYGFFLKMDLKQGSVHIITDVEDGSPASEEGLRDGDILGSVNGENVMKLKHDEAVQKVKDAGENVELTVGNASTMELLNDLDIEISNEFLDKWPESHLLKIPDFSKHENIFKLAATAAVVKAVADRVNESQSTLVKCTLRKVEGAFGFFLRDDAGHFLGNIEKDGAADRAGVKDGDQIIEVNGGNVEKTTHDKVVQMINDSGETVSFLVRRKEVESKQSTSIEPSTSAVLEENDDDSNPRLPRFCELERLPSGYGFNLNAEAGSRPGQYMKKIVDGGAAYIAGVREGDRVIEINDVNIKDKTHDDLVNIIRTSGSKFTVLVVDEAADLYYKKKGIEIIKDLINGEESIPFFEQRSPEDDSLVYKGVLDEMAILTTASETRSINSSVVEIEATVHVDPDDDQDKSAPEIEFPSPPMYEKEEEVADLIEEAITEAREKEIEELEEIASEIREHPAVEIVVEEIKDEIKEEIQQEIAEDIVEQVKEDIQEELQEIAEELREEAREDMIEELREDAREEAIETMKEEIREEIMEDVRENIADGIKVAAAIAVIDEIRDAVDEESDKEEIIQEVRETQEEMKERMEKEMREKIEREMREKMEEEFRQKIAAEAAAAPAAIPKAPEPPKPTPISVIASTYGREIRPKSPEKKAAPVTFTPKVEPSVSADDINKIARSLRSVKRVNDTRDMTNGIKDDEKENEEKSFKPSFMSARAMFEGGIKQPTKTSWQRSSNTSVKQGASNAAPKVTPAAKSEEKPQAGRQTNWSGGAMSFKIVETSSAFK